MPIGAARTERGGGGHRGRLLALALIAAAWLAVAAPGASADQIACGQVLKASTTITNSLAGCSGDGLVVGAGGIDVNLNGHTIAGTGLGVGVRNNGHDDVTIRNGALLNFDYGIVLGPGTVRNAVTGLKLTHNEWAAIQLNAASHNNVSHNHWSDFTDFGIHLTNGSSSNAIVGNTAGAGAGEPFVLELGSNHNWLEGNNVLTSSGHAVRVQASSSTMILGNRLAGSSDVAVRGIGASGTVVQANRITSGGDAAVLLEEATTGVVRFNAFGESGDAGVILDTMSNSLVKGNSMSLSGDAGVVVRDGSSNVRVIDNIATGSSDSGIFITDGAGVTVRGNFLANNTGGVEVSGGRANRVEFNLADRNLGLGIEISGSTGNTVFGNTTDGNLQGGIWVDGDAVGNMITGNAARTNGGDGLSVNAAANRVQSNLARNNQGWGIYAMTGVVDGGGNGAGGNAEAAQCYLIACSDGSNWRAPVRPPEPLDPLEVGLPTMSAVGPWSFSDPPRRLRRGKRARVSVVKCKRRRDARGAHGRSRGRRAKAVCRAPYMAKRTTRRVTGHLVRKGKPLARGARRVRGGRRGSLAMLARRRPGTGRYMLVLGYRDARGRTTVVRRDVRVRHLAD